MAKGINKTISIFVNGKEVENSVKGIQAAMNKLRNEMNKAEIGSKEYVAAAQKIKTLKGVLEEHNQTLEKTVGIFEKLRKKGSEWSGAFQSIFFVKKFFDRATSSMQEYVDAYTTIDDALIDVI